MDEIRSLILLNSLKNWTLHCVACVELAFKQLTYWHFCNYLIVNINAVASGIIHYFIMVQVCPAENENSVRLFTSEISPQPPPSNHINPTHLKCTHARCSSVFHKIAKFFYPNVLPETKWDKINSPFTLVKKRPISLPKQGRSKSARVPRSLTALISSKTNKFKYCNFLRTVS